MWDVIHSMHSQYLIFLATIAFVFSSCSLAGSLSNALQAFDWMEDCFGIKTDVVAPNTLLSAEGHTRVARDFLKTRKHKLRPDGDSYAILMEGWENEGDGRRACQAFDEMVERFWDWNEGDGRRARQAFGEMHEILGLLRDKSCFLRMKFFRKAIEH